MSVALVHGWGMHGGIWGPWIDALPDAIALDLPGHGRRPRHERLQSLGEVADDLVTTVGRPATWIGWSLGGLVALRAALDYPDRVTGLVLIGSAARFVRGDDWPQGMASEVFEEFAAGLEQDYVATLDRFMALEVFGSPDAREHLRVLRARAHALEPPARGTLRDGLALLADNDLRARLGDLRQPTLLVVGSRDRLVSPRAVEATGALLPNGRVEIIRGAGHAPFIGHADELLDHVRRFLAREVP